MRPCLLIADLAHIAVTLSHADTLHGRHLADSCLAVMSSGNTGLKMV